MEADQENGSWLSAAQIADLLNERFPSLHITSVKVGKLINRIEQTANICFQRKTLHGSRLVLCPPQFSCSEKSTAPGKADDIPFIPEETADEETVTF